MQREQTQGLTQHVVALGFLGAALLVDFLACDLQRQAFQAVAAAVGDGAAQFALLRLLLALLRGQACDVLIVSGRIVGQVLQALVQQPDLVHGEKRLQRFARGALLLDRGGQFDIALAVGDQRLQQRHLRLSLQHRPVGAVQVVEVRDQRRQARSHVEGFEHVAAHEVGQVAHRLHRHRLVEQLQRLLVVDAEVAAQQRAVGREAVFDHHAASAQALAQLDDVGAEVGEVARDAQALVGHRVQPQRLTRRVLQPEHLRQRHRLVVAGVVEHGQDHRVTVRPPQRHRPAGATQFAASSLVVAQHIAAQRAFAGIGAGGLVVGHAVGRHQQRGHGVDQGRLARADVARQQGVAALGAQRPHAAVEGAPVVDLQPLQPKARQAFVGREIQRQ